MMMTSEIELEILGPMNRGASWHHLVGPSLRAVTCIVLGACAADRYAPAVAKDPATPHAAEAPLPSASGVMRAVPETADDGEELEWDSAVGWERRREFPPGVTSMKRPEEDYLNLRYAGLGDRPEFLELIVRSKGKLQDKPIIGTGDQLCNREFGNLLRKKALPRLLVTIEDGLRTEHLPCLESLGVPRLYLSLCSQPAPNNYRSCGGEDDLRILRGATPTLLERIRGIAVGLKASESWQQLRAFPQLRYLTVRGPAAGNFDVAALTEMCGRSALVHLDILDPAEVVGTIATAPDSCGLLRHSFSYWRAPKPTQGGTCNLRRLFVWNLSDAERQALDLACPKLHATDVVSSQKSYRR